jgi:predicted acetyltransferase
MADSSGGELVIRRTTGTDRTVVERLWQLYSHDMSQFRGSVPNAEGLFKLGRLEGYLGDADADGYLATIDDAPVGFAYVMYPHGPVRHMGDFFVVRSQRRRGVGHRLARDTIELYPGPWEIAFQAENAGAPQFWRRVVSTVVGNAWREELRPVPDKPWIPPDHWLVFELARERARA